jgi:Leucine-rich repeat (LRR) protein
MLVLSKNHIQSLPSLPEGLETLYVDYNGLRSLPQLPPSIVSLYVQSNGIYHLPTLPHSLIDLNCEDNCIGRFPLNFPEYIVFLQTEGNPADVSSETFERLEYLERHT